MSAERAPPHPGSLLRVEVLDRLKLSVSQAAHEMKVARQTLHSVLAGRAAITPDMALRIGRLSATRAGSWLDRQQRYDLWHARRNMALVLATIIVNPKPRLLRSPAAARHA